MITGAPMNNRDLYQLARFTKPEPTARIPRAFTWAIATTGAAIYVALVVFF